jgi:hypothetical protein
MIITITMKASGIPTAEDTDLFSSSSRMPRVKLAGYTPKSPTKKAADFVVGGLLL